MMKKKIVTLELTGCSTLTELHLRIKTAFDFPDFYGENWDAFADLLWSECDADRIEITGAHTVPGELMPEIAKMRRMLLQVKKERDQYGLSFDLEFIS